MKRNAQAARRNKIMKLEMKNEELELVAGGAQNEEELVFELPFKPFISVPKSMKETTESGETTSYFGD